MSKDHKQLCARCRRMVPVSKLHAERGCHLCMKPENVEHAPRHRYDCGNCKFSWQCGLPCSCVLNRTEFDPPPEDVMLDRLHALLNFRRQFIKNRESLDGYIESIWKDK